MAVTEQSTRAKAALDDLYRRHVGDVPAGVPDEEIELDGLVKALQKIPPAQREALVMRELEGRSYQEIAELLGITISAIARSQLDGFRGCSPRSSARRAFTKVVCVTSSASAWLPRTA